MKNIDLTSFSRVVFTGDIHGCFRPIVYSICQQHGFENTLVVVCGDIGMGFYRRGYYTGEFEWMQNRLEKSGNALVMFRGNHDNPEYFNNVEYFEFQYGGKYPNCFLVPDYTVLNTSKGGILCIGGAVSIDRSVRTEDVSWWRGEKFKLPSEELYSELSESDFSIVATHTCPQCCGPIFNNAMGYENMDPDIMCELLYERLDLLEVFENLNKSGSIGLWVYGHFHGKYTDFVNGTKFVGLDMLRNSCADIYELKDEQKH